MKLRSLLGLKEAGKRHSSVDAAHLQEAHDHIVSLGAACNPDAVDPQMKEALREATLRVDDSMQSKLNAISKAVRAAFYDPDSPYGGPYVYVRDCFDTDAIVQVGDEIFQVPYTFAGDTVSLGDPIAVDVAYIPSDGDDASGMVERKIPAGARTKLSKKTKGKAPAAPAAPGAPADQKYGEAAEFQIDGDLMDLHESAVGTDGSAQIKIIQPGWGSSGYYPASVLKRDGPKVFTKGTKMFWNHQTAMEESERPEGDIDDFASELTGDATYQENGPTGAGLYAPIKVFSHYAPTVNELSKSIGVSIRAKGRAKPGKAEGRDGQVIESIEAAKSIDYVTSPGAGGEILALFESARPIRRSTGAEQNPVEKKVDNTTQTQLTERISLLEKSNQDLLRTVALGEAATFVAGKLKACTTLPAASITRLQSELSANPVLKENRVDVAAFGLRIEEAIKNEAAYVSAISGSGKVRNLGESTAEPVDEKQLTESQTSLEASFRGMGLSESAAKLAANGR